MALVQWCCGAFYLLAAGLPNAASSEIVGLNLSCNRSSLSAAAEVVDLRAGARTVIVGRVERYLVRIRFDS